MQHRAASVTTLALALALLAAPAAAGAPSIADRSPRGGPVPQPSGTPAPEAPEKYCVTVPANAIAQAWTSMATGGGLKDFPLMTIAPC
ncbi:hypothetical protein [Nonomuraea dietziae]|uniref:hypothetical protein n=1 Tax=Nonomuraea dietziae TaxID=65515 RepID=UPI0033E3B6F6